MIVDGQEGKGHKKSVCLPIFSPDSERLAYISRNSVFLDGHEGKEYDGIEPGSLVFSPDSRRVSFIAVKYEGRIGPFKSGERRMVVADGQEGEPYDRIFSLPQRRGVIFDSPDQLHYIAQKDKKLYLVEERFS